MSYFFEQKKKKNLTYLSSICQVFRREENERRKTEVNAFCHEDNKKT